MSELEALLRVAMAAALGGVIGFERELHEKGAGLRTHALVAFGAALFTVVAIRLLDDSYVNESLVRMDPSRVIAGVVGGVGFLGGAVVFRGQTHAHGLTTAAGIWAVTGIGVATGQGSYILSVGAVLVVLIILYVLKFVEELMGTR